VRQAATRRWFLALPDDIGHAARDEVFSLLAAVHMKILRSVSHLAPDRAPPLMNNGEP